MSSHAAIEQAIRHVHDALLLLLSIVALLVGSVSAQAQEPREDVPEAAPSPLRETLERVARDPTTYAPAVIVYTSQRLDWSSSQPLFRVGFLEANPRFTRSGSPFDVPVSYADGHRRILRDSSTLFARSLANNAACAIVERMLIARAPRHRKLIRTLGWIERVSLGSYWSYRLSAAHFRQWRENERLARELGAR